MRLLATLLILIAPLEAIAQWERVDTFLGIERGFQGDRVGASDSHVFFSARSDLGYGYRIYRSADDAATWEVAFEGFRDFSRSAFLGPLGNQVGALLIADRETALLVSNDDGETWTEPLPRLPATNIRDAAWLGSEYVIIGADSTYLSADVRTRWVSFPVTEPHLRVAVYRGVAYALTDGGTVQSLRSEAWMETGAPAATDLWVSGESLWIKTEDGALYTSRDGATWVARQTAQQMAWNHVALAPGMRLPWVLADTSRASEIYLTDDEGQSVASISAGYPREDGAPCPSTFAVTPRVVIAYVSGCEGASERHNEVLRYPFETPQTLALLDPSFGISGKSVTPIANEGASVVAIFQPSDPSGSVTLLGSGGEVIRILNNGARDLDYGAPRSTPPGVSRARDADMDEKGRIYVYGQVTEPATGALYSIWRIGLDGRLDTAFGNGGYGLLAENFFQYITTGGARLPDGSFILKGSHRRQAAFYKVTPEGLLDTSYGSNGIVFNGAGGSEDPFAVDDQGRVLQVRNRFGKAPDIIRYMVSGERDMTFGTDGAATVSHPNGVFNATAIRIGPQGRIFLAGDDGESQSQINAAHVARFLSDGQIDTSFGQGSGVARILIEGEEIGAISSAAVTDDGGVYLVGSRSRGRFSDFLALRADSDGLHDMTWGEDGRVQLDLASSHDYGDVVDIDADGRVLIGGSIFAWDQENLRREIGLVRLLPMEPVAAGPQPPEASGALTLAPNPTRSSASVWLELSAPEARATVVVYDALGREVALLHDGPLAGGNHAFETPGGIAAGVYLVRASLGARAVTRAFTVVR